MALKAGYYGIKKNLVNKLTKLTGIYSIGSGLNLSSAGALSAKNATTSQKGIVQLDEVPTDDSTNVPTSGGVYDALAAKQDTLTFDDTPTESSTNPVKSGGVYGVIQELTDDKLDKNSIRVSGVSVDNLITAGIYYCAGEMTGLPYGSVGTMFVIKSPIDTYQQIYIPAGDPAKVYIRRYWENAWSSWYLYTGTVVS